MADAGGGGGGGSAPSGVQAPVAEPDTSRTSLLDSIRNAGKIILLNLFIMFDFAIKQLFSINPSPRYLRHCQLVKSILFGTCAGVEIHALF